MPKLYSTYVALLKMSYIESFSYLPLEAMACRRAVMIDKVIMAIEFIVENGKALVVKQRDISRSRVAVPCLLDDRALRGHLIAAGFEAVKNRGWERFSKVMRQGGDSTSEPSDGARTAADFMMES